jgi:hypothetical protein
VPTTANQQLRLKSKKSLFVLNLKKIFSSNIKKAFLSTFLWQNFVQQLFLVRFYCLIAYHVGCFTVFFAKGTFKGKSLKDNHTNSSSAKQVLTLKVLVELN